MEIIVLPGHRGLAPTVHGDRDACRSLRESELSETTGCNAVLFELLNQIDGLAEDADVLFILTTNRAEVLEPALASRPGRIDQAVEIPLPDDQCRARLFDLYGRGLRLEITDRKQLGARTKGVSAEFIRELLRRAALFAADEGTKAGVSPELGANLAESGNSSASWAIAVVHSFR